MRRSPGVFEHDDDTSPPAPNPRDVGTLAAGEAIRASLGPNLTAARTAGLVILRLPDDAWVPAVVEAWAGLMQGGREPRRAGRLARLDPGDWISVAQDGRGTMALDDVERALVSGAPCLIAAVDPTWVPPAVAALADIEANIEPLDWRILRYVAARAAGLPSSRGLAEPGEAVLAQVTPRLLRLAYRCRGGAEGLLRRALAAAEASRPPSPPKPEQSGPRGLARVPGIGQALGWGQRLAADLRAFRDGKLAWRDVDRGALLAGPPGTGKTTFARALAEEAGVRLVATSFAEWQSAKDGHLGSTLAAMQLAFRKARMVAPCILFIDELDSLPDRNRVQPGHGEYWRSVVNGFLAEVDGAAAREGVVIIGACNDAHVVEPAVLRSGRLERIIQVALPDAAGLEDIMRLHLAGELAEVNLAQIADEAAPLGLTGADVERMVREARREARVDGVPIRLEHLRVAVLGAEEETRDPELLWRIAVHEAGHAVTRESLRPGTLVEVSLRPHGASGGRTMAQTPSDEELTPSAVRTHLIALLAARAAEELLLGEPGAGSGLGGDSDLAQATRIAALAVAALGYDEEAGLVWQGLPPAGDGLARWLAMRPEVAARVRVILGEAHEAARDLLAHQQQAVVAVAEALVRERTLRGEEVRSFLERKALFNEDAVPPLAA